MIQVPVSTDADQEFITNLNGQQVKIRLRWQDIGASWFISLYNSLTNEPYIIGHRLMSNRTVFGIKYTNFIGDIFAYSESNPDDDIDRNGFDNDFNLYYINQDEKDKLRASTIQS